MCCKKVNDRSPTPGVYECTSYLVHFIVKLTINHISARYISAYDTLSRDVHPQTMPGDRFTTLSLYQSKATGLIRFTALSLYHGKVTVALRHERDAHLDGVLGTSRIEF